MNEFQWKLIKFSLPCQKYCSGMSDSFSGNSKRLILKFLNMKEKIRKFEECSSNDFIFFLRIITRMWENHLFLTLSMIWCKNVTIKWINVYTPCNYMNYFAYQGVLLCVVSILKLVTGIHWIFINRYRPLIDTMPMYILKNCTFFHGHKTTCSCYNDF